MTKRGLIVGTPEYMAPEQADGRADRRSDIYSLGVVLYQMLTGRLPFRGDSPLTVAVKHITEAVELPSQIAAVNPRIEAVCVRALGKTPDERYGSAREMRSALRAAINLAPSRASAPQAVISGADSQSGPLFGTRRTPPGQPSAGQPSGVYGRRRHASLVVGLALATLFAAALGARSWWVKSQRVAAEAEQRAPAAGVGANVPTGTPTPTPTPTPTENLAREAPADSDDGVPARRNKALPARETRDKSRRTARATATARAGGKGAPGTSPVAGVKGGSTADDPPGAKTPAVKAGVTAPTATTPPVAPAPLDLGHASVSIASITSTSAIPGVNIRAALSRSPLVRCYREALHAVGAAATGTAVLHLKIDIAGYVTSTELEGAQFLPGVKPCVEKATRGVRVKDVDTGDATADVTLTFACPP